jgi:hypothetical protein
VARRANKARGGALVKVISGPSFGFEHPDAVSSDGTHVWVANWGGQSVTELPATEGPRYSAGRGDARRELRAGGGPGRCRAVAVTEHVSTSSTSRPRHVGT